MKAFAAALFIAATSATEAEWAGRGRSLNRGLRYDGNRLVKTGYTNKTVFGHHFKDGHTEYWGIPSPDIRRECNDTWDARL